jgi:hypothetical protein
MLRNYTLPLCLLACAFFFSCEEPIEWTVDEKSRLVVFSNFSSNNNLEVFVSKTKSVTSGNDVEYVADATVTVFTEGNLIEMLEYVPANEIKRTKPHYRTRNLQPSTGTVYSIRVSVPGFDPVTATNSIPEAVPIQSVEFSNTLGEDLNKDALVQFDVSVTIKDPITETNFYHLIFYQELLPFNLSPEGDTIPGDKHLTNPIFVESTDQNQPLQRFLDTPSFLIKDTSFDGQQIRLSFKGRYSFSRVQYLPGRFFVELRSVSEAYYLYHITLNRQMLDDNPFSDGVVIYDNIENGTGIFAGFSASFGSFDISN